MLRSDIGRRALLAGAAIVTLPRAGHAATILRWATVLPATHPETAMMERVAAEVKENTGGSVEIQIFGNGQLGSSHDSIESVSSGAIQMVSEGAAQFGQFVAQLSILEAPYIWRDVAHLQRTLTSPLIDELNLLLVARRGMRVIGGTYYGTRQVTSGSRPIHSVADMRGFKIRIPEVDTYVTMAEAWGAKPTPLNFGELYLALSQGAVDGQENPLPTIQATKLNEVQKFLILTGHIMTPRLIVVNDAAWSQLSASQKGALQAALAHNVPIQDSQIVSQETSLRASLATAGMAVITPDIESFRRPVLAALPAKFVAKWGRGLWDRIAAG